MVQEPNNNPIRTSDINLSNSIELRYFKVKHLFFWYILIVTISLILTIIFDQPLIVVITISLPISMYVYLNNNVKEEKFKEIIQKVGNILNFNYSESGSMDTVSGQLFERGHSQLIYNVISGYYKNLPMRIYNLKTIVGNEKDMTTHIHIVFEFTFDFHLQHLLVENGWEFVDFPNSTKVDIAELRGRFKVYTENGMELKTFQIFTPDIAENFVNKLKKTVFNFESFENKLYVFQPAGIATTKDNMADLYDIAMMVLEIAPKLKEIK